MTSATALKFPVAPGSLELAKKEGLGESFQFMGIDGVTLKCNNTCFILPKQFSTTRAWYSYIVPT